MDQIVNYTYTYTQRETGGGGTRERERESEIELERKYYDQKNMIRLNGGIQGKKHSNKIGVE